MKSRPSALSSRIRRLMLADDDVGKVAAATPAVIGRALELFLDRLVKAAAALMTERGDKMLTAGHFKAAVAADPVFDFCKPLLESAPDLAEPGKKKGGGGGGGGGKRGAAAAPAKRAAKKKAAAAASESDPESDPPSESEGEGAGGEAAAPAPAAAPAAPEPAAPPAPAAAPADAPPPPPPPVAVANPDDFVQFEEDFDA